MVLTILLLVLAEAGTRPASIVPEAEAGRRQIATNQDNKMEFWYVDSVPGTDAIWYSTRHLIPRPEIGESVDRPKDLNLRLALSHAKKLHALQRPKDPAVIRELQEQAVERRRIFLADESLVQRAREQQARTIAEFFSAGEREIVPDPGNGDGGGGQCHFGDPDCPGCGTVSCLPPPSTLCNCDLACINCRHT